jgi:hypothetical protein
LPTNTIKGCATLTNVDISEQETLDDSAIIKYRIKADSHSCSFPIKNGGIMNNLMKSFRNQFFEFDRLNDSCKISKKFQYKPGEKPGRVCEMGCPVKMQVYQLSEAGYVLICPRCGYKLEFCSII